jgi:hypothetical protein
VVAALARIAAGCALTLLVVVVATGWLYLLRTTSALAFGPRLREALPLQRLAGGDAQPLARLVVVWLPAGLVAGLGLRGLGPRRAVPLAFVTCAAVLMLFGAAADAVTETEPLRAHLSAQPHRTAIWVAAGLLAAGVLMSGRGGER